MADICFILGNFTVFLIILISSAKEQKIDMLFMIAVYLLTIGTLSTGALTSGNNIQCVNASIMTAECVLILFNRIKYRGR